MPLKYQTFLQLLRDDPSFRAKFAADPGGTLRDHGLDPSLLDLPPKIDLAKLEQRIASGTPLPAPNDNDVAKSPQELWDQFHFIKWKPGEEPNSNSTVTSEGVITAVIYGTVAQVQVAIVGSSQVANMAEYGRISDLRKLTRFPADQLKFAISGPGGDSVEHLNADAMRAVLTRMQKQGEGS